MKNRTLFRNLVTASLLGCLMALVALSLGFASPNQENGVVIMTLPLVMKNYQAGLGSVSGQVTDARTGDPLDGLIDEAKVCFGSSNCVSTDSDGNYTLSGLPSGGQVLTASAQGYLDFSTLVLINTSGTSTQNFPLSPDDLDEGQYRIIVTWDDDPPDLDAHLWTPYLVNGRPHVFQENRGDCTNPDPLLRTPACLDRDAVEGYGPETITILETPFGDLYYHYAVEKYEPCFPDPCPAPIQASNATVRLYDNLGLRETYYIPQAGNPDNKRYWYVFNIQYGPLGEIGVNLMNCFVDAPDPIDDPPSCPNPP